MPRNTRPDFKKMMEDKTVIRAFAYCYEKRRNEAGELEEILRTQYGGYEVLIRKDDATLFPYSDALSSIVTEEVNICIKEIETDEYDKETVWGSMKEASEILRAPVMEKLLSGEVMTGVIKIAVKDGAFLAVGEVVGFMKNQAFSDCGLEIRDYLERGSEIRVKFDHISAKWNIYFVPEEKIKGKAKIKVDNLKPGMVYAGKIVNLFPDRVFVNILPGTDVMCFNPPNMSDLRENDMVQVKLQRVYMKSDRLMVKGKVLAKMQGERRII